MKNNEVNIIVSNSDHEFVIELYKLSSLHKIPVKRVINSKAENRGDTIYELCIKI